MRELGVGIIGCGSISTTYMQNMPMFAGIVLRACADRNPGKAEAQAAKFGGVALTPDELLRRDDIDIVVNLTGPMSHLADPGAVLAAQVLLYPAILVEAILPQTRYEKV